jgi:solute carrier family 30 (zinc transporter), member 9
MNEATIYIGILIFLIITAKLGAWLSSGSSAMLAEFIHSVVDVGNQSLLLVGLRDSQLLPDRKHPYGYGKSVYFWALVSALGTFFLGAGVSMTHAVGDLMHPSLQVITWEVWSVLALSFAVDGYVLVQTVKETYATKPPGISYWKHVSNIRDPATLAILLEDGAACLGIVLAMGGIGLSHATGNAMFDGMAGVAISSLLGAMGIALVRVNHRFLLGQAVDKEITDEIQKILESRKSIDGIRSVQSQWTGPETFSYKAEVDFDGTYLAAKLMPIYQHEFLQIRDTMDDDLQVLLALYAEDVMRSVEREVRHVEALIRKQYPGAEYIELEPMSVDADRLAIDVNLEAELKRVEMDALNRFLKSLRADSSANKISSLAEFDHDKK